MGILTGQFKANDGIKYNFVNHNNFVSLWFIKIIDKLLNEMNNELIKKINSYSNLIYFS